jgi:hypothetical protein
MNDEGELQRKVMREIVVFFADITGLLSGMLSQIFYYASGNS